METATLFLRKKGLNHDFKLKGSNFNGSILELLREFKTENDVALKQADVIKSVCDRCEGNPESADNVLCDDCYSDLHGM